MASATPIFRQYETVVLVRPDASEAVQTGVKERIDTLVTEGGGRVARWETWGKRRLAHEIAKQNKAYYLYANYVSQQSAVAEIERNLRISEPVLKYQTVRLADEVDVEAFEFDKVAAERSALYLSPEEAATIERNYQRERDWAAGASRSSEYRSNDGPRRDGPRRDEAPKQEAAKQEAPKQEAAKQEAAKQEAPKQEAPKQEAAATPPPAPAAEATPPPAPEAPAAADSTPEKTEE